MWKTRAGEEGEGGQAAVELVAVLPVLGLVLALAWQAVVAGQSWWLAGAAAREAARASALGADPGAAARRVLPRDARVDARPAADGSIRIHLAIPAVVPGLRLGSVAVSARMEPQS
jgi:Flp pilus assembly protein TadG